MSCSLYMFSVCVCIYTHINICVLICVCTVDMCVCVQCVRIYRCTHICIYVCSYIYICVCVQCVYIYSKLLTNSEGMFRKTGTVIIFTSPQSHGAKGWRIESPPFPSPIILRELQFPWWAQQSAYATICFNPLEEHYVHHVLVCISPEHFNYQHAALTFMEAGKEFNLHSATERKHLPLNLQTIRIDCKKKSTITHE